MSPSLYVLLAAVVVAAAVMWAALRVIRALSENARAARHAREIEIAALFARGIAAAQADPRALLTWQPLASAVRRLFPEECAALDTAAGSTFPFSRDAIEAAHGRWTADWLAWEQAHDGEYKLKAAAAEAELAQGGALARARLEAVQREKLELYQRRYEEYVRVARALQHLSA